VKDIGEPAGRGIARYIGIELREIEGTGGIVVQGRAPAAAHLRGPAGGVRAGALLTMLDSVGGLCGGLAALPDGWVVSTNLSARAIELAHVGPLRIDSRVLRQGRTSVLTAVEIHDEGAGDALVVDGVLTSAILVPESGPPEWIRPLVLEAGEPPAEPVPDLPEWLGAKPLNASTVEMALAESLRNPWGILHGGAVASLIDVAAEHVSGGITADVVLHVLAPNRVGPVHAEARAIGSRADGTVLRVEVRDHGADRVTALAVVTARNAE
jgi:acyl-coenzyme A thioesterase PaaI-like protein